MTTDQQAERPSYLMGYTEAETARLLLQAAFWQRSTRELLTEAGLTTGQRVLDFGCGAGDVSFLAARLVGPSGSVVGVDRSAGMLDLARTRSGQEGFGQIEFVQADDAELAERWPEEFDAVVGRLVLLHQPDPVECLRRLARCLKPSGLAVFQDVQMASGWHGADPPSPLLDRIWTWMTGVCERAGIETNMGLRLRRVLLDAGFAEPEMLLTGRAEGGADSPVYEYLTETVRSLMPAMIQLGVVTSEELDIDTLAERLRQEISSLDGAMVAAMMIGAFARWNG